MSKATELIMNLNEAKTTTTRFKKKADHYLDTKTKLKWMLKDHKPINWDKAMELYPQDGKWRLPTVKELLTLVDSDLFDPATELPDMMSSDYWSSTINTRNTDYALVVDFYEGYDDDGDKDRSLHVRAIRK